MMRTLVAALVAIAGVSSAIAQDKYPTKPGTPRPIINKLHAELAKIIHSPESVAQLAAVGRFLSPIPPSSSRSI